MNEQRVDVVVEVNNHMITWVGDLISKGVDFVTWIRELV